MARHASTRARTPKDEKTHPQRRSGERRKYRWRLQRGKPDGLLRRECGGLPTAATQPWLRAAILLSSAFGQQRLQLRQTGVRPNLVKTLAHFVAGQIATPDQSFHHGGEVERLVGRPLLKRTRPKQA